jgi:peptidyl-Lys metalloendopeptidase
MHHHHRSKTPVSVLRMLSVLLALVVGLVGQASPASAQGSDATAVLTAAQGSFAAGDDVVVRLAVSNPGATDLEVLRWLTPEPGIEGPIFVVTRDGEAAEYLGVRVKRVRPSAADYLALAAGDVLAWEVELSASWDFAASGRYAIRFDVASPWLFGATGGPVAHADRLVSNEIEFFVEGRAPRAQPRVFPRSVTGSNGFAGCSGAEQTDLIAARETASLYAENAVDYLVANTLDARYLVWFGAYDAGRYATVTSNFTNIQEVIDAAAPMNFDCTCTDGGVYAYVYPNSPYDVYLCGAFWPAPATGTDSKPGVLIHEVSHFTVVAGTDDHAYGQVDAAALASGNPALAIANADNHEYFAEEYNFVPPPEAECAAVPLACDAAGKGQVKIKDTGDPAKRSLQWKWSAGTASAASFGDPTDATNYRLCFYDGSALLAAPQPAVENGFAWTATSSGYKYSNPSNNASGVFQAIVSAGDGNAKIQVKVRGANTIVPALPFTPVADLLVQLVKDADSGPECWETTFPSSDVSSTDTQFKARLR